MTKLTRSMVSGGFALLFTFAISLPSDAFNYECRGDANKCGSATCSGDESACQVLFVRQDGVDPDSGAHVVLGFQIGADQKPQTMDLVLTLGDQLSDCSGSSRDVVANANNGETRSIDGFLCRIRATWTRS